jgi:hypothetical protein
LAAVAAEAAGILLQGPRTGVLIGELTRRRVVRAYEEAAAQTAATISHGYVLTVSPLW